MRVCNIRNIELHRKAITCAEGLLTEEDELPDLCKKSATIVTPMRQEYVYHELESRVSVFLHVKENFTITCGEKSVATLSGERLKQCFVASRV